MSDDQVFFIRFSGIVQLFKKDLLHFNLKEVIDSFSQLKGILPLRIDSLFASKLSPTFVVFDLN